MSTKKNNRERKTNSSQKTRKFRKMHFSLLVIMHLSKQQVRKFSFPPLFFVVTPLLFVVLPFFYFPLWIPRLKEEGEKKIPSDFNAFSCYFFLVHHSKYLPGTDWRRRRGVMMGLLFLLLLLLETGDGVPTLCTPHKKARKRERGPSLLALACYVR